MPQETLIVEVAYHPPLDWDALLDFLSAHVILGVEAVVDRCYLRTVAFGKHIGWLTVELLPQKSVLRVELSASLAAVLEQTITGVKLLFDLDAEPQQIATHLGELALGNPGLRVPGAFDGFEVAARTILGQQVSVKAATTVMGRLAGVFGEPIATPFAELTRLTPTIDCIAQLEIGAIASLGVVGARAKSIIALARAIVNQQITLEVGHDVDKTIAQLKELPGIGEWTAQCIAMRVLAFGNAFPHTDLGIRKALGEKDPKRILQIASVWQPWRAYAAMHLWRPLISSTKHQLIATEQSKTNCILKSSSLFNHQAD